MCDDGALCMMMGNCDGELCSVVWRDDEGALCVLVDDEGMVCGMMECCVWQWISEGVL